MTQTQCNVIKLEYGVLLFQNNERHFWGEMHCCWNTNKGGRRQRKTSGNNPKLTLSKKWTVFFLKVYLFQRQSTFAPTGEGRREEERLSSGLCAERGAQHGAQRSRPRDHDLRWDQESDAQSTEPPRCPCIFLNMDKLPLQKLQTKRHSNAHILLPLKEYVP